MLNFTYLKMLKKMREVKSRNLFPPREHCLRPELLKARFLEDGVVPCTSGGQIYSTYIEFSIVVLEKHIRGSDALMEVISHQIVLGSLARIGRPSARRPIRIRLSIRRVFPAGRKMTTWWKYGNFLHCVHVTGNRVIGKS